MRNTTGNSGIFLMNEKEKKYSELKRLTNDLIELERTIKKKQNKLNKMIILAILILILSLFLLILLFGR